MACLGVGAFPELHVRSGSVTGFVESGVARPTCVGVAGAKGKGFGAGRVKSMESGNFFFKGKDSQELVRRAVGVVAGETKVQREVTSMALSMDSEKRITGAGGAVLEDVPHLTDWLPDLQVVPEVAVNLSSYNNTSKTYSNPLKHNPAYSSVRQYFVEDGDVVAKDVVMNINDTGHGVHFRRAGPREKIYFKAEEVRACVVTCGGLCPGLNTVIREIVCGLWTQYGVREIFGIDGGYRGFYSRNIIDLTPKAVSDIHKRGGTVLQTSRGGHNTAKIVDSIEDRGINQVYIIGGDGTQKGANAIYEECRKRGLKVVVAGIPKTIDNDIDVIDKSFGFDTAVEEAQRAINAAHVEAESVQNGIGLVKLMGRYSGYIAMHATLASRDVDLCLIPEVPFYMDGPGGLIEFARKRIRENGHMVIVVAEGAGQELMAESAKEINKNMDASGNKLLLDVGLWLCSTMKDSYQKEYKETLNLKYIDPTYMIRAIPSNASDNVYCTLLAHSAIHGAMAGYCGFTAGPVNSRHCYIPIKRVVATSRNVNVADRMWARLMSSTNQPNFSRYERVIQQRRKQNAERQEEAENSKSELPSGNGSSKVGSNGHESATGNGHKKPAEIVQTGDRQGMPVSGASQDSSVLTSPVPGEPTPNLDHTAP